MKFEKLNNSTATVPKPLVTIGIPVFNEAVYIEETMQSALAQTYGNIEVIVSDNASTDSTAILVEQFAKIDARVTFIKNAYNIGAVENFRIVRDNAQGTFFMWLGGHDLLEPEFLEDAVAKLSDAACAMVFPKCQLVDLKEPAIKLQSADSDIVTKESGLTSGPVLVASKLSKCYAIHGLYRTPLIQALPMECVYGADDLILFLTAAYGYITKSDEIGLLCRSPHGKESSEKRLARYIQGKTVKPHHGMDRAVTAAYHLKWIWKLRHFTPQERLKLSYQFLRVYKNRYHVSIWRAATSVAKLGKDFYRGRLPTPGEISL